MPSAAAKKRKLRAKVHVVEESGSEAEGDSSEPELEIDGLARTDFVPAWAASAPKAGSPQETADRPAPVATGAKKQKKPKLTKEQRAAAGPPAWRQDSATCPSCVIKPVPGKGRGLVCTRPIKAGEVVVGEPPAVHW